MGNPSDQMVEDVGDRDVIDVGVGEGEDSRSGGMSGGHDEESAFNDEQPEEDGATNESYPLRKEEVSSFEQAIRSYSDRCVSNEPA